MTLDLKGNLKKLAHILVILCFNFCVINAQTISLNKESFCIGDSLIITLDTLSFDFPSGNKIFTWEWKNSQNENFDVIQINDGFSGLLTPRLTKIIDRGIDSYLFKVKITPINGSSGNVFNSTEVLVQIKMSPPDINSVTISPKEIPCEGESISLSAKTTGNPMLFDTKWYADNEGVSLLYTGMIYETIANSDISSYYVRNENDCSINNTSALFTKGIQVNEAITTNFIDFPNEVCIGDAVQFEAIENDGIKAYNWALSSEKYNGGFPLELTGVKPGIISFNDPDNIEVKLITTDENDCMPILIDTIRIYEKPDINIFDENDRNLEEFTAAENFPFTASFSSNASNVDYTWTCSVEKGTIKGLETSGEGSLFRQPNLTLVNGEEACLLCEVNAVLLSGGCEESKTFRVKVKEFLEIPDILTPNGDDYNQTWGITLIDDSDFTVDQFSIKLFDRNGRCAKGCKERFTITDANDWDANDCPAGAYFYALEGPDTFKKTGSLTIIKN